MLKNYRYLYKTWQVLKIENYWKYFEQSASILLMLVLKKGERKKKREDCLTLAFK